MDNIDYRQTAYRKVRIEQYRSRMSVLPHEIADSFSYFFLKREEGVMFANVFVNTVAATGDAATDCNELRHHTGTDYYIKLVCTSKHAASVEAIKTKLAELGYIHQPYTNILQVAESHKIELYAADKQNYVIISNLMSAEIWHRIGTVVGIITEELPADEVKHWRVGDFMHLAAVLRRKIQEEQSVEYNKAVLRLVQDAEEKLSKNPLRQLKDDYDHIKTKIYNLETELANLYTDLKRIQKDMVFAKFKMAEEEKESMIEVFKAFQKHIKSLEIVENRGGHNWLRIVFETDINFFDEESAKNLKNSARANVFNSGNINVQWLLNELFILKKAKLHVVSGAEITLDNGAIQKVGNYTTCYMPIEKGFRNPHHDRYNCWGDYTRTITQTATNGRYEALIQTLLTAISGINMVDAPVMEELAKNIHKFWEDADIKAVNYKGSLYSFKEYYRLRQEEEEEECTEQD